ncbi:MAG: hypothetical protein K9M81_05855 [Chthoniobacterales bacterium]|nr:hypothetical protein [Chthoniobacterales bacterium]
MAISSASNSNSRVRDVVDILSENYNGTNPIPTTTTRDNAITRGTSGRPNFTALNPQKTKSVNANSTYVSQYIPSAQAGTQGLKAASDHYGTTVNDINDTSRDIRINNESTTDPTKNGFNRDSVLNLLVAGNKISLDRQNRKASELEEKILEDLLEKKQED